MTESIFWGTSDTRLHHNNVPFLLLASRLADLPEYDLGWNNPYTPSLPPRTHRLHTQTHTTHTLCILCFKVNKLILISVIFDKLLFLKTFSETVIKEWRHGSRLFMKVLLKLYVHYFGSKYKLTVSAFVKFTLQVYCCHLVAKHVKLQQKRVLN